MTDLQRKGCGMNPRFSFFGFSKDIEAIAAAGYDCIEMHMHEIMGMDQDAFEALKVKLADSPIVCEVLDNPIPLDKVIADDSFDLDFYRVYLEKGAERAAQMGVKFYVFGNGRTRSLPMDGDIQAAKEKNLTFMRMLADVAAERGITVLIEPLAPRVSNVVQSIPEALKYIEEIGKPNMDTFLDYRWFVDREHPYSMIVDFAEHIRHVHIDNPLTPFPQRVIPRADDGNDYAHFFEALQKIDYQGIISIEANTFVDFSQDLRDGLSFLKTFGTCR
ncbi:MAG TPA: sugar phosphate isomerase/epimerase family protein [Anaerolineaceae bacterium]|nr:sugar phosphate isomerase/epimerase family protein [Anaerolineaceae bacterium]